MIATIMQARRVSFLKAHLNTIFKENQNCPSVTLRIKSPQQLDNGNFYIYTYAIDFIM